ncbi:MAG: hypothetical protein RO009_15780 [Pseudorhodoplanes sp.]|jgi:hypothetical protein|nr:hypothetical protein [Pseudorhodoplanes sp.]
MRSAISRRTVLAGAAASMSPVPAVAAALNAGDVEKAMQAAILSSRTVHREVESLWREYKTLRTQEAEAGLLYDEARSRLPRWADAGPAYMNGLDERVGEESFWPEMEHIPECSEFSRGSKTVFRRIRVSPHDIRKGWKTSISVHDLDRPKNKKIRAELRAKYRASMAKVIRRLRQQRVEHLQQGIPQLLDTLELTGDRMFDIQRRLMNIIAEQRDPNALAVFEMVYEGNDRLQSRSLLLMVLQPLVTGEIRADVAAKIEELGVYHA